MTLEIIVFISAILFGILWYWRESRHNGLYRFINKITHAKKLQMESDNKKGFVNQQNFLLRLVWITLFYALAAAAISFATPINAFYVQYFVSAIVGTLIGTYIASVVLFAQESTKKENIDKAFQKGRDFVDDLTDGKNEVNAEGLNTDGPLDTAPTVAAKAQTDNTSEVEPKKSARERFKDKGIIR